MNYRLEVQSEAIIEIQKAFEWYEGQRAGLGYEFIEEIESGFERLCKNPQHYTAINQKYRRLRIKRFPYMIIYEIETEQVVINSIRGTRRKPKF